MLNSWTLQTLQPNKLVIIIYFRFLLLFTCRHSNCLGGGRVFGGRIPMRELRTQAASVNMGMEFFFQSLCWCFAEKLDQMCWLDKKKQKSCNTFILLTYSELGEKDKIARRASSQVPRAKPLTLTRLMLERKKEKFNEGLLLWIEMWSLLSESQSVGWDPHSHWTDADDDVQSGFSLGHF